METSQNTNLLNPKPTKPFHHREKEEEEPLSLQDFPFNADAATKSTTTKSTTTEDHREQSAELFEFLTTTSSDVSPAENIIFAGKLIPLNYKSALFSPPEYISPRIRARSESLSAIQDDRLNRSGSTVARRDNAGLMRTSRSLNYCKLTRRPTIVHSPSSPVKNMAKPETVSFRNGKSVRPRWYVIMFGMVKFPPETELKDIKSRQTRRNIPPVMFPSPASRRSPSLSPSSSPTPSWKLLNALSCKNPTSVAATAPFWVPHA